MEPPYANLHPAFRWVRDYIATRRPAGALPRRCDIDPIDLRNLLPLITLIDVLRDKEAPDKLRFRYRLVGTTQTMIAGREMTGLFIEEAVDPKFINQIRLICSAVVNSRQPLYSQSPVPHHDRHFIDSDCVYFPLGGDAETVDLLFVLTGYPRHPSLMPKPPFGAPHLALGEE